MPPNSAISCMRARQQQGGGVQIGVGNDPTELRTQTAHERCPSTNRLLWLVVGGPSLRYSPV
jgi:hypothetical protein